MAELGALLSSSRKNQLSLGQKSCPEEAESLVLLGETDLAARMRNPAKPRQDGVPREEEEGDRGWRRDGGKVNLLFTPESRV